MSRTPRLPRSVAALFAAALFLGAPPLPAETGKKLLVLPYQHLGKGLPEDLGEQTTVVVVKEISHGGVHVMRAENVVDASPKSGKDGPKDTPTGDADAGLEAEELIKRGKEASEEAEFERATTLLKKAAELLEKNADAVQDLRLLPEVYLQLGVAHFRDGQEDEGDDMLNRAVHLDPERTLEAADYPPIFIRVFERARFNVLRRPRARIEVKAARGAHVFFDGRNMGKAPILLADALPGRHWVRIERPGDPIRAKELQVNANRTITLEFEGADASAPTAPVGVLGAIAENDLGPEHMKQLQSAGARAGADFVMFGGIYKTGTAYQVMTGLVSVKTGIAGRAAEVAFDLDLLSAEIEVFKLAEDVRAQVGAGDLASPVSEPRFVLAPKLEKAPRRRELVSREAETRMATVAAAPPPSKPPNSLYAEEERAPKSEEAARAPAKSAPPSALPKDELESTKSARAATTPVLLPKDERGEREPSTWWIWVLVGVAAAGALGGGVLIAGGGSADQGTLRIRW